MNMPEELGGGGLDYQTMAQVERELGKTSAALVAAREAPDQDPARLQGRADRAII